jgi:hypothetical protein
MTEVRENTIKEFKVYLTAIPSIATNGLGEMTLNRFDIRFG